MDVDCPLVSLPRGNLYVKIQTWRVADYRHNSDMWINWNPNPTGRTVGDCSIRAVAKALNTDWETAYVMVCDNGLAMSDMPSSDSVWGAVLRQHGFYKSVIPNRCPDCYTAGDFCKDNPVGTYVLGFGGHVCTVVDGDIYDTWDSSKCVPVYVWYRKDGA